MSGKTTQVNQTDVIPVFFSVDSYSMKGKKFDIAVSVVRIILDTLTKQDYVNVICARASHWDAYGK